jgi:hypothetical protein
MSQVTVEGRMLEWTAKPVPRQRFFQPIASV